MANQQSEVSQLHRLAGQIRGIEKLIEKNAKTSEIIQQIEAAKGSLTALEKKFLTKKVKNHGDFELERLLSYILKNSS